MAACTAKENKSADSSTKAASEITVNASDTECKLSGTQAPTGPSTFVITNNGTKVTEFYVYGEGERVMGEVENISPPGLQRKLVVQLAEPAPTRRRASPA